MRELFSLALVFLFAASLTSHAQQDVPAPQVENILRELEQLEQKYSLSKTSRRTQAIKTLSATINNNAAATKLYQDATNDLKFRGLRGANQPSFTEWRKKNADALRSPQFTTALQFHIRYLLIGLQTAAKQNSEQTAELARLSWLYVSDLADALQKKELSNLSPLAKDILFNSAPTELISQWLNLTELLPENIAWESSPGNLPGILESNVRPALRQAKDPRLIASWDLQLQSQADEATAQQLDYTADQFNTIIRPKLLFSRAMDRSLLGQPNRAIFEVLQLFRDYPTHPDALEWSKFIREALPSKSDEAVQPPLPPPPEEIKEP